MATNITVIAPDVRRATVKVLPNTYMIDVLEEACKKLNMAPGNWTLK